MKNLLILFCSLLILAGVFGDEVSVKEGDSDTLEIKSEEIKGADDLVWKFNTGTVIAKIDLINKSAQAQYPDERFKPKLELDPQTGSLTITNIRTQHSGEYKLEIRGSRGTKLKTFNVSVSVKVKVSVMERDNVTLPNDVTVEKRDVKWKFNGADLTGSRFKNIEVNNQTGNLKITNIRRDQFGEYEVNIGGSFIRKTFSVNVSGEEKKSVNEGQSVTLDTNVTRIQTEDVIQWSFNDSLIAHLDKTTQKIQYDDANRRFTGRLNIDWTGSLIINNIRLKDSGVYEVNITGSKIIHKRFTVTVSASSGEKTVPGLLVLLVLMGIIMIL